MSYAYGFGGDLGGGPYDRRASLEAALQRGVGLADGRVARAAGRARPQIVATLGEAVTEWNKQPAGTQRCHRVDGQPHATRKT